MPPIRAALLALLVSVLLGPRTLAQDGDGFPDPVLIEPAPAGCWTVAGGNPARSRANSTPAPARRPERAWRYEPEEGRVVGEPLAWRDFILLEEDLGKGKRRLVLLDRRTGDVLGRPPVVKSDRSLAPSLWGGRVVVRADEELLGYGLRRRGLVRSWRRSVDGAVGEPLVVDDQIFVVIGEDLAGYRYGRSRPEFEVDGAFCGPLAVRGGKLFGLERLKAVGADVLRIAQIELPSGRRLGERPIPTVIDARLGDLSRAELVPMAEGEYVRFAGTFPLAGGQANALFSRGFVEHTTMGAVTSISGEFVDVFSNSLPLLLIGGGWIGRLVDEEGTRQIRYFGEEQWSREQYLLARDGVQTSVLERDDPPAASAGQLLLGGVVADSKTLRVDYRLPSRGVTIPILDGFLTRADDGGAVECWLAPAPASRGALDLVGVAESGWTASSDSAFAILASGERVDGALMLDPTRGLVESRGSRESVWPFGQLALVAEGGDLVWAAGDEALLLGVESIVEADWAERIELTARRARSKKDPELTAELISLAAAAEIDPKVLEGLVESLEKLERKPKSAKPGRGAELLEQLGRREAVIAEGLWGWVEALEPIPDEDRRRALQFELARMLVELRPDHERLAAWVRAQVAEEVLETAEGSTSEWVEFLDAGRRVELAVVEPPETGRDRDEVSTDERRLALARMRWREDLVGVGSEELLVVTPLARPGAIAWMAARGELLCDTLEQWFSGFEARRRTRRTLEIRLYGSREEYQQQAFRESRRKGLDWTAGHYDPRDVVTRFFLPSAEKGGLDEGLATFLHEVTHHWLDRSNPAYTSSDVRRQLGVPGYWIVEGFASMVEDVEFDVESGEARPGARLGWKMKQFASVPEDGLVPWELFFGLQQAEFVKLDQMPIGEIEVPFQLGMVTSVNPTSLFYAQAAASTRYLMEAEGGRYRQALLDYVVAYYMGEVDSLDLPAALGIDYDELGSRIRAWAAEQVEREITLE